MKETTFDYKLKGNYIKIHGYHVTKEGLVYHERKYKDGHTKWFKVSTRKNKVNDGFEYERFTIMIDGVSRPVSLHNIMAQIYVPGYERGLVCDHIDRNPLNNDLSNLQWITRGENSRLGWERLSEAERIIRAQKYSEGVKAGHAKGSYDNHLQQLHKKAPTEAEMNKMVSYFKTDEELKEEAQIEIENLFKN